MDFRLLEICLVSLKISMVLIKEARLPITKLQDHKVVQIFPTISSKITLIINLVASHFRHKIKLVYLEMDRIQIKTRIKTIFQATNQEVIIIIFKYLVINRQIFNQITNKIICKICQIILSNKIVLMVWVNNLNFQVIQESIFLIKKIFPKLYLTNKNLQYLLIYLEMDQKLILTPFHKIIRIFKAHFIVTGNKIIKSKIIIYLVIEINLRIC